MSFPANIYSFGNDISIETFVSHFCLQKIPGVSVYLVSGGNFRFLLSKMSDILHLLLSSLHRQFLPAMQFPVGQ